MALSFSDFRNKYNNNYDVENVESIQISYSLLINTDVQPIVLLPELISVHEPVIVTQSANKRKNVAITQKQIVK